METVLRTKVKDLLKSEAGKDVLAKGWVRTKRGNKNVAFIALNDGSTINNIQIVVDKTPENEAVLAKVTTGACIAVWGKLVESMGGGQATEIQATAIEVYGECDPVRYPLQKKDTSFEFLRTVAHLRPRTNTFGAIYRVRNQMAYAIHKFFHEKGFVYMHTPLITASDCEGAGQMFRVTTLDMENLHVTRRVALTTQRTSSERRQALQYQVSSRVSSEQWPLVRSTHSALHSVLRTQTHLVTLLSSG